MSLNDKVAFGKKEDWGMLSFLKITLFGIIIVIILLVTSFTISSVNPYAGVAIGALLFTIPLIAAVKPISSLRLNHRGINVAIVLFVGLPCVLASWHQISETKILSDLKKNDPQAYLAKIEHDEKRWLQELKELFPERFEAEKARLKMEREEAEKEAARLMAERNAKERAAREQAKIEHEQAHQREQAEAVTEYVSSVEREIASIESFNPNSYTNSQQSLTIGLALFSAWAKIYEEGKSLPLDIKQEEKRRRLKNSIIKQQKRSLPIFRDQYGPIMRKELWEHDVTAKTFGSNFTTVEFVAGFFAANRNIKQFQESASDTLHMLRFKRAQYKWYKGADEYTYYDIRSLSDDVMVIWESNGRYRTIE